MAGKRTVADIGSRPTYRRARKSTGRYRGCLPISWRVHSDASRQARAVARLRARYRVAFRHTSGGVISFPPLAANTLGLKAGRGRSLIPCCAYSTSVCPSLGRKQLFGRPRWARIPLRTCQIHQRVVPLAVPNQRFFLCIGLVGGTTKIWR